VLVDPVLELVPPGVLEPVVVDAVVDRPRSTSGVLVAVMGGLVELAARGTQGADALVVGVLAVPLGSGLVRCGWVSQRPIRVDSGLGRFGLEEGGVSHGLGVAQLGGVALQRATGGGVAAVGLIQLTGKVAGGVGEGAAGVGVPALGSGEPAEVGGLTGDLLGHIGQRLGSAFDLVRIAGDRVGVDQRRPVGGPPAHEVALALAGEEECFVSPLASSASVCS
jgi:hypothetical protein